MIRDSGETDRGEGGICHRDTEGTEPEGSLAEGGICHRDTEGTEPEGSLAEGGICHRGTEGTEDGRIVSRLRDLPQRHREHRAGGIVSRLLVNRNTLPPGFLHKCSF